MVITKGFVAWLNSLVAKTSAKIPRTADQPRRLSDLVPPPIDSELASLLYVDEVLAGDGSFLYIDSDVSVSALPEAGSDASPAGAVRPKGDPQWLVTE